MRRGGFRQSQPQLDHLLHLVLFRPPVADNGPFDFGGCVLHHVASGLDGGQDCDPAGMAQLERTACVDGVKDAFDGHAIGLMRCEQPRQFAVDSGEPLREGIAGGHRDGSAGNE